MNYRIVSTRADGEEGTLRENGEEEKKKTTRQQAG
jgi:hypothetical protein